MYTRTPTAWTVTFNPVNPNLSWRTCYDHSLQAFCFGRRILWLRSYALEAQSLHAIQYIQFRLHLRACSSLPKLSVKNQAWTHLWSSCTTRSCGQDRLSLNSNPEEHKFFSALLILSSRNRSELIGQHCVRGSIALVHPVSYVLSLQVNEQILVGRDLRVLCYLLSGESEGSVGGGQLNGVRRGGPSQWMRQIPCRNTGMHSASLKQTNSFSSVQRFLRYHKEMP